LQIKGSLKGLRIIISKPGTLFAASEMIITPSGAEKKKELNCFAKKECSVSAEKNDITFVILAETRIHALNLFS
jgi:hypothetical protein